MTRSALTDAAAGVGMPLPKVISDVVRRTSEASVIAERDFGIALRASDDELVAILISGSPQVARSLTAQVQAFIGPSYARNRPTDTELEAVGPFADAVREISKDRSLQVISVPLERRDRLLLSLDRLIRVRERTPLVATQIIRPLASILRDFEAALARKDISTAIEMRVHAWRTGRLSLVNLSFLEARIKALEGDFEGLLKHVERLRLMDLHLPGPVEHAVIDAIGRVLLSPVNSGGAGELIEKFREEVAPRFGPVFRDHRVAASPAARWAWVAHYLSIEPRPSAALHEVVSQAMGDEQQKLISIVGALDSLDVSAEGMRVLAQGGEDAAVFAAAQAGKELDAKIRAEALKRSTAALGDPVRDAQAQAILEPIDEHVSVGVPDHQSGSQRSEQSPFANVDDWGSWLRSLYAHPDANDAVKVLVNGSARWTERLRLDEEDIGEWADYIQVLAGETAFRRALPFIVQAVLPTGPAPETIALDRAQILEALAYAIEADPDSGTPGLDALGDLAGALICTGLNDDDYERLISRCEAIYRRLSSPPRLASWVIDLTYSVLREPAPSEKIRSSAIRGLVALLLPDAQRAKPLIASEVWAELAEILEGSGGVGDVLPTVRSASQVDEDAGAFDALKGKTVLFHTLVESAGNRARDYLVSAVDVRVIVDDSHVGSDRLRDLATRADLVVVASRAAKHAAFNEIRPAAGDRLTYARGKGWSSLISAVSEALSKWK